jgi:ferredoxin-NADP reductase
MAVKIKSHVLESRKLTREVKYLKIRTPSNFRFKPGQFILFSAEIDGKGIQRAFSIASPPNEEGFIELCVKNTGRGVSNYIWDLRRGEEIEFAGPFGHFTINDSSKAKDLIFFASGTGISPFMSMIPYLLKSGYKNKAILVKSARSERDILYEKEFLELKKKHPNFDFYNVLSRPEDRAFKYKGYIQDYLDNFIQENFTGDFYLCGLRNMVDVVRKILEEKGVSGDRIFFERYD